MARIPYWPDKDPNDTVAYSVDWSTRLGATTIATSEFSLESGSCTLGSDANTTTTASVSVSGGTQGETCVIQNRVTTSASEQFDQTILLRIRRR